jgi:glucose/arabinose dehydrogenase
MPGRLRLIRDGVLQPEPIAGIPEVYHSGASKGLMDIALHPKFAENRLIYFTYNKSGEKGVTEVLARGVYDGTQLTDVKDVFVADAWAVTDGRQNSRITYAPDGTLYMTGSAGGGSGLPRAQQLHDHAGKILRIREDGSVPEGNPFIGRSGYRPEIYTYGHQNIHAITIHPETGEAWSIEHGDEANILKPGGNYGVGLPEDSSPPSGVEVTEPHLFWREPDIHPSGMAFYTGDRFPNWKGNLFIGGLRTEQIHRVAFTADGPGVRENLFSNIGQWVRDVRQAPDGLIYFTTYDDPDAPGRVMRIEPVE